MKKLCILFIVVFFTSCGTGYQVVKTEVAPVEEILNFDHDNSELTMLTNIWLNEKFNNVKPIVQSRNEASGEISATVNVGSLKYSSSSSYSNNYDLPEQPINILVDFEIQNNIVRLLFKPDVFNRVDSNFYNTTGIVDEQGVNDQIRNLVANYKAFIERSEIVTTKGQLSEKIVQLEASKNELYIRANKWMVTNFNNAKSVIQFSDKEGGVVTGKYLMGEYSLFNDSTGSKKKDVFALITIDVKNNAAKISIVPEQFQYFQQSNSKTDDLTEGQVELQLTNLLTSFENYMKNHKEDF